MSYENIYDECLGVWNKMRVLSMIMGTPYGIIVSMF